MPLIHNRHVGKDHRMRRGDLVSILNAVLSSALVIYMLHVERELADLTAKVEILLAASGIEVPHHGREAPRDPRAH